MKHIERANLLVPREADVSVYLGSSKVLIAIFFPLLPLNNISLSKGLIIR